MNLSEDKPEISDVRAEKEDSVEKIFHQSYAGLVYFSFKILGDRADAEDIVQDSFVNYWNGRHEVARDKGAIKAFLYALVKNASLNRLKHRKVILKFEGQAPTVEIDPKTIETEIIRAEVLSEIQRAIESLPPGCRQVSQLSYIGGKKNHEIAEELGISINTVKTQKQRSMQLLRSALTQEIFTLLVLGLLR